MTPNSRPNLDRKSGPLYELLERESDYIRSMCEMQAQLAGLNLEDTEDMENEVVLSLLKTYGPIGKKVYKHWSRGQDRSLLKMVGRSAAIKIRKNHLFDGKVASSDIPLDMNDPDSPTVGEGIADDDFVDDAIARLDCDLGQIFEEAGLNKSERLVFLWKLGNLTKEDLAKLRPTMTDASRRVILYKARQKLRVWLECCDGAK